MHYILSSAVVTAFGVYVYRPATPAEARAFIEEHKPVSTIGYKETADALGTLLDIPAPATNRANITMQAQERALVFRLTKRVPNPADKGSVPLEFILDNYEMGFLTRHE